MSRDYITNFFNKSSDDVSQRLNTLVDDFIADHPDLFDASIHYSDSVLCAAFNAAKGMLTLDPLNNWAFIIVVLMVFKSIKTTENQPRLTALLETLFDPLPFFSCYPWENVLVTLPSQN